MRATKLAISIAILLAVAGGLWWYFAKHPVAPASTFTFGSTASTTDQAVAQVPVAPLTKSYTNDTFRFSLNYPDGYTVHAVDDSSAGGTTVLIENTTTGKGIQIFISKFDDTDTNITPERIAADLPDLTVTNPQSVNMTAGGGTGLAFESDNEAFDGHSREVWFVFHGNLYQISTYLEYDALLKAMLGTWKFF